MFYIYLMVEKIKLLDDVDLVCIYSAGSLFMTQFEAPQLSARKGSFSLSVNALSSLIKPDQEVCEGGEHWESIHMELSCF